MSAFNLWNSRAWSVGILDSDGLTIYRPNADNELEVEVVQHEHPIPQPDAAVGRQRWNTLNVVVDPHGEEVSTPRSLDEQQTGSEIHTHTGRNENSGTETTESAVTSSRPLDSYDLPAEVREKLQDFQCTICMDAMIEPVQASCPARHKFCRFCIKRWMKMNDSGNGHSQCPVCRELITATYPLLDLDTEISELFNSLSTVWQLERARATKDRWTEEWDEIRGNFADFLNTVNNRMPWSSDHSDYGDEDGQQTYPSWSEVFGDTEPHQRMTAEEVATYNYNLAMMESHLTEAIENFPLFSRYRPIPPNNPNSVEDRVVPQSDNMNNDGEGYQYTEYEMRDGYPNQPQQQAHVRRQLHPEPDVQLSSLSEEQVIHGRIVYVPLVDNRGGNHAVHGTTQRHPEMPSFSEEQVIHGRIMYIPVGDNHVGNYAAHDMPQPQRVYHHSVFNTVSTGPSFPQSASMHTAVNSGPPPGFEQLPIFTGPPVYLCPSAAPHQDYYYAPPPLMVQAQIAQINGQLGNHNDNARRPLYDRYTVPQRSRPQMDSLQSSGYFNNVPNQSGNQFMPQSHGHFQGCQLPLPALRPQQTFSGLPVYTAQRIYQPFPEPAHLQINQFQAGTSTPTYACRGPINSTFNGRAQHYSSGASQSHCQNCRNYRSSHTSVPNVPIADSSTQFIQMPIGSAFAANARLRTTERRAGHPPPIASWGPVPPNSDVRDGSGWNPWRW